MTFCQKRVKQGQTELKIGTVTNMRTKNSIIIFIFNIDIIFINYFANNFANFFTEVQYPYDKHFLKIW